jgi:hypothetical protein
MYCRGSAANATATPRPMPELAPVTTQCVPANPKSIRSFPYPGRCNAWNNMTFESQCSTKRYADSAAVHMAVGVVLSATFWAHIYEEPVADAHQGARHNVQSPLTAASRRRPALRARETRQNIRGSAGPKEAT